jgi:hypothetical protein
MTRIYILIFVMGIIGIAGYGAKYYYDTTQATIAVLQDNNAKLEVAVQVAEESVSTLKADMAKIGELNKELTLSLQKAEAYGDELRTKLTKLNLVVEALKDSKQLEGKMNGASADLWRGLMEESGNTNQYPDPQWLLQLPTSTGSQSSNPSGEGTDTDSSQAETTPTQ